MEWFQRNLPSFTCSEHLQKSFSVRGILAWIAPERKSKIKSDHTDMAVWSQGVESGIKAWGRGESKQEMCYRIGNQRQQ